jgi:hypothetical protein
VVVGGELLAGAVGLVTGAWVVALAWLYTDLRSHARRSYMSDHSRGRRRRWK